MERLKFLLGFSGAFFYRKKSGGGMAVEGYNLLTDQVRIRHSMRGYVTVTLKYPRKVFLEMIASKSDDLGFWEKQP